MMNESSRQAILELSLRKISEEEFRRRYPVDLRAHPEHIVQLLDRAGAERSADDVEYALLLGFRFGFPREAVPVLNRLLTEDWHQQHENMALALTKLADSSSVDSLYAAAVAKHGYLDYDEAYALAVKSIWALGAIGTNSAKEKLELLAQSENEIIRTAAREQRARLET